MSEQPVASQDAGGRTPGTAARTGRLATGRWVRSSSNRCSSAAFPSRRAFERTSMPRPPSTSHWTHGYGPRLCPTTPRAPSPPPSSSVPIWRRRVAPPSPASGRSPTDGAACPPGSTASSCLLQSTASRPASTRSSWRSSLMPSSGSMWPSLPASSSASLWLARSPTPVCTAPSSRPCRTASTCGCSRPSTPAPGSGTAASTTASPRAGGARTRRTRPIVQSLPKPPRSSPRVSSWARISRPTPSTSLSRSCGRNTRGRSWCPASSTALAFCKRATSGPSTMPSRTERLAPPSSTRR